MNAGPVLVTGSGGRIGQAAVRELRARGHAVRGFDRVPTPGLADAVVGTLTSADDVARAMHGAAALIHMAATPDDDGPNFLSEILPNNIVGVYHVLEAARHAGVRRVLLASSGQVSWFQRLRGPWPIRVEDPLTPRSWYACSKAFLEAAGRSFAEQYGMAVVAVRLGWCPRTREQIEAIEAGDWAKDVYLSPGDAGRLCALAIEAPLEPGTYAAVYATSRPVAKAYVDLEPARRVLGYEPRDRWPEGIQAVTDG